MKVLMAAPFEVKGRYQGGISAIANAMLRKSDYLAENDLEIIRYETCRIRRSEKGSARLSLENLINFAAVYFSLPGEVKEHAPQILYFHSSVRFALLKDLLALSRAKRKTGVRTIFHIHFAEYEKIMTGSKAADAAILRILKKYADKIIFLSRETAEDFIAQGISRDQTAVVYNFSTAEFTEDEQAAAVERSNEKLRFLFAGSLDRRKGICDLFECFTQIQEPFEFHICGGYSEKAVENEVKNYIKQLGASVIEHGYVSGEEKKSIYLDSDVLALPSYGEGLPVVIMEAYHAACAVISTSVGAIPEVVGKDNGFLVPPGGKKQLLAAMKRLMADRELLKRMKKANAELSANYTLKRFIHDIANVCKALV